MPGWELIGKEEQKELNSIFHDSNGVMFAHGFNHLRNDRFRVREFENKVADYLGTRHGLATTSGTMAQYIAMKALNIGPGDEVITQAFTFVATVETIIALGATPVIVDIDETYNMDPRALESSISSDTKLIVPVHMLGNPCRMNEINSIAKAKGIPVMEDGCEAFGAEYGDKRIGNVSDISIFSFDFAKTITTGEGGGIFCNSPELDRVMREYHDHGHESNPNLARGLDTRSAPGLNLRMSELQAAVGLAQLEKIEHIVTRNRENKSLLKTILSDVDVIKFREITDSNELADTLIFNLPTKEMALKFADAFAAEGYGTKNLPDAMNWHFSGTWNHMFNDSKYYKDSWRTEWHFSRDLLERSISIPILVKEGRDYYSQLGDTALSILREI